MIGVVAATAAGRQAAHLLAEKWPAEVRLIESGSVGEALAEAWETCDAVVSLLAVGATVRVLAPLLGHKTTDPAVVCVDEARRFAVALLGGHHGANDLAVRLGEVLGCTPVVTTATDAAGQTALDGFGTDLGFRLENPGALPALGTAVLNGTPVRLLGADGWALPPLPPNVTETAPPDAPGIVVSDRRPSAAMGPAVYYRPPSLCVGVGSARGVSAEEVGALVDQALQEASLHPLSVRCVATVDLKADEQGILAVARERGWEVVTYPAGVLAEVGVPNPSEVVRAEVGTPSVAEAAALHAAGTYGKSGELVVAKRKSANATVAVARLTPRGRLAIVGLGPGARDLLTPRAVEALQRASVVVGLDQYVDQIRDLLRPGTRVLESGLGQEEERARTAVREARRGQAVALIGSGDAGVYAMASPALEFADLEIEVDGVPGITAAVAAASLLGAPLGHDHAYISLSDLHTPWEVIERRVRAAAEGDFTVCFYNPRSKARDWQLSKAIGILAEHRPPGTPVGFVRNASRSDQTMSVTTLAGFDPREVDMFTVVLVGGSLSRAVAGRFVTPRGYRWS
jgi:cobalt-precorrin 5A hydrolase/precorrin-3B C17-methyltransferase